MVVVWSFLAIIEPPQLTLFNSVLDWVVAIMSYSKENNNVRKSIKVPNDEKVFVKDEDNQVVSSVTSSFIDQSDTGLSSLSKGGLELEKDSSASVLVNSNVDKQSAANSRNPQWWFKGQMGYY